MTDLQGSVATRQPARVDTELVTRWLIQSAGQAGWAPVVVFSTHVLVSRGLELYEPYPHLDVPMHLAGGVAIAYFFRKSLGLESGRALVGSLSSFGRNLLTLALTGTATAVWELAEWSSDALGWTAAQKGLTDTMFDMALGMVGGLALVVAARVREARS